MGKKKNKTRSPAWDLNTFDGHKKNRQKKLRKHRFGANKSTSAKAMNGRT